MKEAGVDGETVAALGGPAGGGMTATIVGGGLDEMRALIGQEQYHEVGEFPVERGYVWTSCASVENGNPLYWDDEVADGSTGGPIAPPSMVSVWFRPAPLGARPDGRGPAAAGPLRPEGSARPARGGHDRQHH